MRSFGNSQTTFANMPPRLGVTLSRGDTGKGREELYGDQLPEVLRALSAQTRIESIRASNAIEGIDVSEDRAERLTATSPPRVRDRSEQEFAGYRDAIDELMREERLQPPTPTLMLRMHRQLYAHTLVEGGSLKQEDNLIGERGSDGAVRKVIFHPPSWQQTEGLVVGLFEGYNEAVEAEEAHPLVLLAAFVVDLLAIHPVEDGNGRIARLLTMHELLRRGYGVARYVSVEQRIYESRNSYYAVLAQSQRDWNDAKHDVWPWTEYLVSVIAGAYDAFEARVAAARGSAGMGKSERVRHWILESAPGKFKIADVRKGVPGVSDPTIRNVLHGLRDEGRLRADGQGRSTAWVKSEPA
jgi:Fic family protein